MRIGVLRTAFSDFLTKRRHVDEVLFWAKPEKVDAPAFEKLHQVRFACLTRLLLTAILRQMTNWPRWRVFQEVPVAGFARLPLAC